MIIYAFGIWLMLILSSAGEGASRRLHSGLTSALSQFSFLIVCDGLCELFLR